MFLLLLGAHALAKRSSSSPLLFPCLLPHLQTKLHCSSRISSTRSGTLPRPEPSTMLALPAPLPFAPLKLFSRPSLPVIHLQGCPTSSPRLNFQGCSLKQNQKRPFTFLPSLFPNVLLTYFLSLTNHFSAILPSTAPASFLVPLPDKLSRATTLPGLVTSSPPSYPPKPPPRCTQTHTCSPTP